MHVFLKQMAIGLEVLSISQRLFSVQADRIHALIFSDFHTNVFGLRRQVSSLTCSTSVVRCSVGFGLFATAISHRFSSELPHPQFLTARKDWGMLISESLRACSEH